MKLILLLVVFSVFVVTYGDDSESYHYLDSYFRTFKEKNSTLQAQQLLQAIDALKDDMRSILYNARRIYANKTETMGTFRAEMFKIKTVIEEGKAKRPQNYKYAVENHELLLDDSEKLLQARLLTRNRTLVFNDIDAALEEAGLKNTTLKQDWDKRLNDLYQHKTNLEACANGTIDKCTLSKEEATKIFSYIEILRIDMIAIIDNYPQESSINEFMHEKYIEPLTCLILVYCGLAELEKQPEQLLNSTLDLKEEMKNTILNIPKIANETYAMNKFREAMYIYETLLQKNNRKKTESFKILVGNHSLLLNDSEKLLRARLLTENRTLTFHDVDAVLEKAQLKNTTLEQEWNNHINFLDGIIKDVEPCLNNARVGCFSEFDTKYYLDKMEAHHSNIQNITSDFYKDSSMFELAISYIDGVNCQLMFNC